jgi:hypothetical protein
VAPWAPIVSFFTDPSPDFDVNLLSPYRKVIDKEVWLIFTTEKYSVLVGNWSDFHESSYVSFPYMKLERMQV